MQKKLILLRCIDQTVSNEMAASQNPIQGSLFGENEHSDINEAEKFNRAVQLKIWDKVAVGNWRPYEEAKKYNIYMGEFVKAILKIVNICSELEKAAIVQENVKTDPNESW